jgi:hypothetical protein
MQALTQLCCNGILCIIKQAFWPIEVRGIKESFSKVIRITAIIVLIKALSAFHAIVQLTFVENISIPDVSVKYNHASGIYDIIFANGFFCLCRR